jgi:Ni,Fe-hydrogenase I small subunit
LTSGPMTVGAQRGTCHMRTGCRGPEVKTQKCMHKYYLDMY